MPDRKIKSKHIASTIYINMDKEGDFGNSMLLVARTFETKADAQKENNIASDIVFLVKDDFDESIMHSFKGEKILSLLSVSKLLKENIFLAIKPIPCYVWDLEKSKQIHELRIIKEALTSKILGEESLITDLTELSVLLTEPYSRSDNKKFYFKQLSSSFGVKVSEARKM